MLLVALALVCSGLQESAAQAGATSSSAHYGVLHAPPGSPGGGGPVSGGIGAISAEISICDELEGAPGEISGLNVHVKPNLVGQLYDPRELAISAIPDSVNERSNRQLSATATLDDATTLAVVADQVAWSESSTALAGISVVGLATAAGVYQDTVATVHGTYLGIADPDGFDLTVLNIASDDFENYAADGIDDDWQVAWFGLPPNEDAGPAEDPDADQQNNLFEFLSGFSPTDPLARFELRIVAVDRVAGTADLQLNRVIPDRIYTLKASPDLVTPFAVIGDLPAVTEPETGKIIRDTSATAPRNFYIIGISKP
jgi:hypothetical protein